MWATRSANLERRPKPRRTTKHVSQSVPYCIRDSFDYFGHFLRRLVAHELFSGWHGGGLSLWSRLADCGCGFGLLREIRSEKIEKYQLPMRFFQFRFLFCFGLILALLPQPVRACAACFGQSDSPLAKGMNMGIFSLLAVIVSVLGGIAAFAIYLVRRSAALASAPPAQPPLSSQPTSVLLK